MNLIEPESYEYFVQQVYDWQYRNLSNFYWYLITAYRKADRTNKIRIAIGYPLLVKAIEDWNNTDNPTQFFEDILGRDTFTSLRDGG